jgi:hypothetical protein
MNLATGYLDSPSAQIYFEILKRSFDGFYKEEYGLNLRHKEVEKVWKRFCRLVSKKLDEYRDETGKTIGGRKVAGDASNDEPRRYAAVDDLNPNMKKFAAKNSFAETVHHLVQRAIGSAVRDEDAWYEMNYRADSFAYKYLADAEKFMTYYYFQGEGYAPVAEKTFALMKKMFLRQIAKEIKEPDYSKAA